MLSNEDDPPITPEYLAELFCELDSNQQADFFEKCGEIERSWNHQSDPDNVLQDQWFSIGVELLSRGMNSPGANVVTRIAASILREKNHNL